MEQHILTDDSLYAWQREALEAWRSNGRIGIVQAVTAAGTVRVGLAALQDAWLRGKRIVIVVPTLELVVQWVTSVRGVVDGSYVATTTMPRRRDWRVLICTADTLAKIYPCRQEEAPLLIADECHLLGAEEFAHVLDDRYDWRLGLTATYARDDGADDPLQTFFKGIVFDLWYDRALAENAIAPFRIALVSVPLSPDERSNYDEFCEAMRHSRQRLQEQYGVPAEPIPAFLQALAPIARSEAHPGLCTARRYMSAFSKRRTLLADARAKYQALAVMHEIVSRSTGTLVFTQTQTSAEMALQTIAATGHDSTAFFSGLDTNGPAMRMEVSGSRPVDMLIPPLILDERSAEPKAGLGIILAANRTRRQMVQRLGHVLHNEQDRGTARIIVLYAADTVEDPTMLEDPSGFYTDCLPHAEAHQRFEIATDVDALLDFLWATEAETPLTPPTTKAHETRPFDARTATLEPPTDSPKEIAQTRARAAEILRHWDDAQRPASSSAREHDSSDILRRGTPTTASPSNPAPVTGAPESTEIIAQKIWSRLPANVADRVGFANRVAKVGALIESHLVDVPPADRPSVISAVRRHAYQERPKRDARFATAARALISTHDARFASRKLGISAQTIRLLVASYPHDVSLHNDYLADFADIQSSPAAEVLCSTLEARVPAPSPAQIAPRAGAPVAKPISQPLSQAPEIAVRLDIDGSQSSTAGRSVQSMASDASDIAFQIQAALLRAGAVVHLPGAESFPDIVALHPHAGLIVMDISTEIDGAMVALNRKFASLRASLSTLDRVSAVRRIVSTTVRDSTAQVLSVEDATATGWLDALPAKTAPDGLKISLQTYFGPRVELDIPIRDSLVDTGAGERATRRIQLDAAQSEAARMEVEDVLAITGPPGSGKSLVLAARARWIADEHRDWHIAVLCFNNALVPYLRALIGERPNVTISTLGKFAYSYGVRVDFDDPDRSEKYVREKLPQLVADIDAVLIDEWQDFDPAWTQLALALLRRRRGGLTVAGDPRQALRRDGDASSVFAGRTVKYMGLATPYRSTRPVLDVTAALGEDFRISGTDHAPNGKPVDLVWAQSWPEQANAAAHDVQLALKDDLRRPQDVGVLVTRKRMIGRLVHALNDLDVPARAVYATQAGDLDLSTPDVKVMTVHSAKGLEFDVAVLVGLEELPPPSRDEEAARQGRTGYVGTTRARDQLIITYTKNSIYLDRIRALPETTLRPWVWPDDYPEV